ncbi:MarR family winged helix-turn-helix transcriptional regulator [Marinobacterium lutimaris]|uniref:DNA-binding transcriptional regulator, MarR family n=1 Tax=Marinobacterium lutimaris TaxID=568106 RepID=A0A1H6AHL1_9GAMM|nr:MarR family transcriptional regulator [Marinobacterium lutimaris]SEG47557.1 DNA-binding transcriptional regulator, MarR family [Marinobacterium lutimaris]
MSSRPLSDTLHRLMHAYRQLMLEAIREQGIELPITHIRVLKGICRIEECTAHHIASQMRRDRAQIARVISELVKNGLIIKVSHPKDRRSQLLEPTAAGLELRARLDKVEEQVTQRLTNPLSADEIEIFEKIAGRMTEQVTPQPSNDPTNEAQ